MSEERPSAQRGHSVDGGDELGSGLKSKRVLGRTEMLSAK